MNGLIKALERITPIVMLICCICFGITYTFDRNETQNITYLTHETIVVNDRNTTTTADDITIDNYTFDFTSYRQNLDIQILQRATQNVIDIDSYNNVIQNFNRIWQDGYQFGDGIQTIVNALILVIDSIIFPINIFLTPLRIIAGIFLTTFSILGINITRNTPIINMLNGILDNAAIPLINPTFNKDDLDRLVGESFRFNDDIIMGDNVFYTFTFKDANNNTYIRMQLEYNENNEMTIIRYIDANNIATTVYINEWANYSYKVVTIVNLPLNTDEKAEIYRFLSLNATQITE